MDMNKKILELIENHEKFAVATILKSMGSTPRTSGSRMIVKKDGQIHGTIGGGIVEAEVIKSCIRNLEDGFCEIADFNLNKDLKDSLDMVCGGSLSVLLDIFDGNRENYKYLKSIYSKAADIPASGGKSFIISKIEGKISSCFINRKSILYPDGSVEGNAVLPYNLIKMLTDGKIKANDPVIHTEDFDQFIIEQVSESDTLFIFGCGHVGYKLAEIANIADFKVIVTDDREEFANRKRFGFAEDVRVTSGYEKSFDGLKIDKNSYIVILTRGHLHDQTVLEEALKHDAAYIGMIGSRRKRDQIYENLLKKGVKKAALENVYSPVGLKIGSETPAEIAVSIIAEIIKVRSEDE